MTQKCEDIASSNTSVGWIDTNAITRIIKNKAHRIRWTIENVSKLKHDSKLAGPDFYLSSTSLVSIAFKMDDSNIFIYLCNKSDVEIEIERKIFLFDCHDKNLYEDHNERIYTLRKGEDLDMIGSVSDVSRFATLPKNKLIIDMSISIIGSIATEIFHPQSAVDPHKKLIEDLKNMQENSVKYDVSLQIGNEKIHAHWSVLCSRSPYFRKMFDSEMLERVQNTITITDLSLCTLKKLIDFLYTANFVENDEGSFKELLDLYYAADKYEMLDMRTLCSSKIMSKTTADNVCQIFQLAHRHNDNDLKLHAMNFIQFHSGAVFETDDWKNFEASEPLAAELFSFCVKKNKFAC